ncbi:LacI family DNA-binding transcriptional regulator [Nocardiopsis sp. NPDC058631]|uniref:LacI family DNA-binding transcriptional regulator n=1 Tax=Nocardiopsis sp. NPDC058631 TaxID=3346566 RepID=UPI00364C76FD
MAADERAGHRRPTTNDVASEAWGSRGTVSRVLTGEGYVSKGAWAAVLKAVRQTGYVANRHARGLATQRSKTVAFVLSEPRHRLFEDPNFSILLRECTRALAVHDIMLVLTIAGDQTGRERVATITGPLDTPGGVERLAGFRNVLGDVDRSRIATGDYSRESGSAAMP